MELYKADYYSTVHDLFIMIDFNVIISISTTHNNNSWLLDIQTKFMSPNVKKCDIQEICGCKCFIFFPFNYIL